MGRGESPDSEMVAHESGGSTEESAALFVQPCELKSSQGLGVIWA